jgi:hypothetical protein
MPALLWIAGYLMAARMRHKSQPHAPGEPLRQRVETSLAQVEHQIELLRAALWWAVLPLVLATLPFVGQVTWRERSGGWLTALVVFSVVAFLAIVFAGVYSLNLYAVRSELEPRRRELQALRAGLEDESPAAS